MHPTPLRYVNPVWDGELADPFVWRHEETYYAIGTGAAELDPASDARVFPLLRSRDFVTWQHLGGALVRPPGVPATEYWAPAIAVVGDAHYLYYSAGQGAGETGGGHTLRVAVSPRPEGPYRDVGQPLMDRAHTPFAIDPHPFRDVDGTWWLFYARDFLDVDEELHAGTALVVGRLRTMTTLASEEHTVLRARHDWTLYQPAREMYGQIFDWHTLEGPCVVRHGGRYWCFFSGACYGNTSYGVDYAVADHVLGPWSAEGGESGPRVLRTIPSQVIGPGHNSHVLGPDGRTEYLAYHAWDHAGRRRQMCLDRLRWTAEGPRCTATWTAQEVPSRV